MTDAAQPPQRCLDCECYWDDRGWEDFNNKIRCKNAGHDSTPVSAARPLTGARTLSVDEVRAIAKAKKIVHHLECAVLELSEKNQAVLLALEVAENLVKELIAETTHKKDMPAALTPYHGGENG